jgi:hypothetical protein
MHRFACIAMAASLLLLLSRPSEVGTIYYR